MRGGFLIVADCRVSVALHIVVSSFLRIAYEETPSAGFLSIRRTLGNRTSRAKAESSQIALSRRTWTHVWAPKCAHIQALTSTGHNTCHKKWRGVRAGGRGLRGVQRLSSLNEFFQGDR